jgi:hypothetical protein
MNKPNNKIIATPGAYQKPLKFRRKTANIAVELLTHCFVLENDYTTNIPLTALLPKFNSLPYLLYLFRKRQMLMVFA